MRVLLVEDDRQLRTVIARGLREAAFAVEQAATGTQALTLALENEYDLIILDIMLPGKDGISVCRAIRKKGGRCRSLCSPRSTASSNASKVSMLARTTTSQSRSILESYWHAFEH